MTVNITLPNGMIITDPEQFGTDEYDYAQYYDTY